MNDKEKIKRLRAILQTAINELYESAEDWYQEELLDILGTDEDELNQLGITI